MIPRDSLRQPSSPWRELLADCVHLRLFYWPTFLPPNQGCGWNEAKLGKELARWQEEMFPIVG